MPPLPHLSGLARHRWRILRGARRGVAALEFALTVPVLVFLLFGMYDLSMGWITRRRLETSATAVGQIATMEAAQPDQTNWLTTTGAQQAASAINAAMPETKATGAQYAVVLSEVVFSNAGCDPNGAQPYCVATVLWSKVVMTSGTSLLTTRACGNGKQNILDNTAPPDQTGMPASTFTANPVLVVDVAYTFTPLFLSSLFGSFPMKWVAYYPPRFGSKPDATDQKIQYGVIDDQGNKTQDPTQPAGAYCP